MGGWWLRIYRSLKCRGEREQSCQALNRGWGWLHSFVWCFPFCCLLACLSCDTCHFFFCSSYKDDFKFTLRKYLWLWRRAQTTCSTPAALEPKETRWAVLVFSHSLKVKSFWGGSGTMTQDYWTRPGELRAPHESPYMLSLYFFRHPCFLPLQLCWDHLSYKQAAAGL